MTMASDRPSMMVTGIFEYDGEVQDVVERRRGGGEDVGVELDWTFKRRVWGRSVD